MIFGLPTTLPAILDAIGARAAACVGLDPAYVFPSLDLGDMAAIGAPTDVFIALTPLSGMVEQGDVMGGGPDALSIDATLAVELWTRVEVDESYRDTAALKDATFGILARWRLLLNRNTGLQLFAPVAVAGAQQSILKEPMRLIDWSLRPRIPAAGWVKHVSRWQVKYLEDTTN
jgi:hypothetical protein